MTASPVLPRLGGRHHPWHLVWKSLILMSSCLGKVQANYTFFFGGSNQSSLTSSSSSTTTTTTSPLIHPDWDSHIKDLEHLLEVDLQRIESDAKDTVDHQPLNATLGEDLLHIRQDIDRLVSSIKDVEQELGRTKHMIDKEERNIQQMTAQMETEKFLDGLHRGKLAVKVDYVTGELVSTPKLSKRKRRAKRRQFANVTVLALSTDNETTLAMPHDATQRQSRAQPYHYGWDEVVNAGTRGSTDDDEFTEQQKRASETVRQHIASHPDIKSRMKEEMEFLKSGYDPAVLNFDARLMLDIVKLAMTASLFGLAAVFLKLPPTAGFLLGGMLIGPSCFDLLGESHQVQTLAQFGAIFVLFEQGLLYAQTYSDEPSLPQGLEPRQTHTHNSSEDTSKVSTMPSPRTDMKIHSRFAHEHTKGLLVPKLVVQHAPSFLDADDDHDPTVVGSIILTLLVFVGLAVVFFTNVADSVAEAIMVSCSIAVCSTTIVSETLSAGHIAETPWGLGVLKMISMHDLFMVPLLALPELLSSLDKSVNANDNETFDNLAVWGVGSIVGKLVLVAVFLKGSTFVATYIIRAAIVADGHLASVKGELFTLSVVAYALMIATVSDELSMSIEAGAVLAGIALFKSPYVPKVLASIQPITSVFGGMYLTSLGMIISPMFVLEEAGSIVELVVLIGLFKLALVSAALNRFFGYGIAPSIAVGSSMAQISEVSLLVLAKSQRMGLIRRKTYLLLIPTTCIMLTLAPLSASLLQRLPKVHDRELGDDMPRYLCFLKYLRILRQPNIKKRRTPFYSMSTNGSEV